MKTILIVIKLLLLSIPISAQVIADYETLNEAKESKKYQSYISKTGDTISIGDTLIIGTHSADDQFLYITQAGFNGGPQLAGEEITIKRLIVEKKVTDRVPHLYVDFRGWGLAPLFIKYERALEVGEIINPNAKMTKEEAIDKLKEAKELLELDLISQSEFDSIKTMLTPIIMAK